MNHVSVSLTNGNGPTQGQKSSDQGVELNNNDNNNNLYSAIQLLFHSALQ